MHCIREYHRRCRDLNDAYKPCAYIKCFFSIFRIFGSKKIAILECTKKSLKHSPSDSSIYYLHPIFNSIFILNSNSNSTISCKGTTHEKRSTRLLGRIHCKPSSYTDVNLIDIEYGFNIRYIVYRR